MKSRLQVEQALRQKYDVLQQCGEGVIKTRVESAIQVLEWVLE